MRCGTPKAATAGDIGKPVCSCPNAVAWHPHEKTFRKTERLGGSINEARLAWAQWARLERVGLLRARGKFGAVSAVKEGIHWVRRRRWCRGILVA